MDLADVWGRNREACLVLNWPVVTSAWWNSSSIAASLATDSGSDREELDRAEEVAGDAHEEDIEGSGEAV